MINLMYLVLTALLALNVSNEILNAFKTLSNSIDRSNLSVDQRTKDLYDQIVANEHQKGQEEKVKPFRIEADSVTKRANDMVAYLDQWKKRIIMESGGYDEKDTSMPARLENIDATTKLLVENKGGDTLRAKIMELRRYLLAAIPWDSSAMSPLMPLIIEPAKKNDHNPTADWNIENFEHMPTIAAMALFSKFKNDVRSSEGMIIKDLFEKAHAKEIKFDTLLALAVPSSTYVLQGDKVEANILLAAFNSANKPTISMSSGGGTTKPAENGVIHWETSANGNGKQTVAGTLTYDAGNGAKTYPWKFEYMVGSTGASMQLDKMNVFYIGVDNPITVSAAGYSVEDVSIQLPAGFDQKGEKGHYTISTKDVTNQNKTINVDIYANGKQGGGVKTKIASIPVRVRKIPDPVAYLLGKKEGMISAAVMREAIGPVAKLENFEFDATFQIRELQFSMLPKGGDYVGPYTVKGASGVKFSFNPDVQKVLSRLKAGDKIFIEGIKGVGPDNTSRSLNPIILTLN